MNQSEETPNPPSTSRVYRSAITAVVIAWSMRLIGLVSVLVLARVLTPADFGIVALAMATLSLIDVFSALGLRQALLRVKAPERAHYDTVWTINLLILTLLALIVSALGPVMAWFYGEPALTLVIIVLASRFILFGLANIGIVDFDRNLDLGRDLKMRLIVRLTTFFATLAAALILRNYWALVVGAVLQGAVHCVASYIMHPYRPRFSLAKRAEMLGMSLWMFLASAAQTLHTEMERFIVGRFGSLGVVGFYSVSKDLSSIFTQEIATALNRVTFVTTAKTGEALGKDPVRLRAMLGTYAMIAAPLGFGLAATSDKAVQVLLGEQWIQAAPFLELIAPAAAFYAVFKLVISSLQASGKAKQGAILALCATGLVATFIAMALINGGGPLQIATAALIASLVTLVLAVISLAAIESLRATSLLFACTRPFAAAVIMLVVVKLQLFAALPLFLALAADVALGGMTYIISIGALWLIAGKPQGAETNAGLLLLKVKPQASAR